MLLLNVIVSYKLLLLEPLDPARVIPLRSGIVFYQNLSFRLRKTLRCQELLRCRLLLVATHFCAQAWRLSYVAFATLRRNRRFSILLLQKSMKNRLGAGRRRLGRLLFALGCSGLLLGVLRGVFWLFLIHTYIHYARSCVAMLGYVMLY